MLSKSRFLAFYLIGTLSAVGCVAQINVARPELFHPRTEAAKAVIERAFMGGVYIEGPSEPMVAEKSKKYEFRIYDKSSKIGERPAVITYPSIDSALSNTPVPNIFTLMINGTDLEGLSSIEVVVIGKAAESLSVVEAMKQGLYLRRLFGIEQMEADEEPSGRPKALLVNGATDKLTTFLNVWSKADTEKEFGKTFAEWFIACDVNFENGKTAPLLIYGSSLHVKVRYLASREDVKKQFGENALKYPDIVYSLQDNWGKPVDYLDFPEIRRPMSFSDILAIFEYQQKGNPRQRTIDYLKSVGQLATAAAIFVSGADYAKGVAIFTGVFTPELEKHLLWDISLHLKNLQSRSLKEIEEIPPYGQLHRVVFFPRGPIYNIIPQMPLYISEIKPENGIVNGTIIKKEGTVEGSGK